MKIFFIRHGETTGDVENRYGGTYDDYLSPKGIEQSQNLANTLKDVGIEVIYASSLSRAQETARLLSESVGCAVETVPALQERNQYSFLSGIKKGEAMQKYPSEVEMLKDKLNTIAGAESYEDFRDRITAVCDSLIAGSSHDVIAIVCHGGPLRILFRDILKWGELSEIGDCAWVELEKAGDTFSWIRAENIVPTFEIA